MQLAPLRVLSDDDLAQIHEATLHILEHAGVKIGSPRLFEFLRDRGLPADADTRIVRFPRAVIEEGVAKTPARFEVHDRSGRPAFVLGDGVPRIAAGHNAVFWLDSDTGVTRPSTCEDVAVFSRLCQHLPHLDMIGIPVMPQDVPNHRATLLYGVREVITNSDKPVFFSTDQAAVNRACIELLRAAFEGDFDEQVYGISQLSPTSPLTWEEGVCEAILDTVTTGVPLAILPEPNAGVSAPFTLAGLLTVNNAEALSGLAMIQMLKPGHKVLYANSWTTTDMRTGAALVGSVETSICRIAGAQLARFYGVPCHTTAPNSDNHAPDEQNAWEKTLSTFCAVAAGNDLIVNCGMFATGMTCSHEQLVMDEEISALSRRLARGLAVNADTIAQDLIEQIGPQGPTYLTTDHTLKWLRSDEYHVPSVTVRGPFASWQAAGAPDTTALARAQARELAARPVPELAAERQGHLADIIAEFGG
jgi:trimethylamine--corrinoid protein Co-methyltransferase